MRLITITDNEYGLTERDVELAREISAVARGLGAPADPSTMQTVQVSTDEHAPTWWTLADAEGNEADVCTWQSPD